MNKTRPVLSKNVMTLLLVAISLLAILFFCLWAFSGDGTHALCANAANDAYTAFLNYRTYGDSRDYWIGVAKLQSFADAYTQINGSDDNYSTPLHTLCVQLIDMDHQDGSLETLIVLLQQLAEDYNEQNVLDALCQFSGGLSSP